MDIPFVQSRNYTATGTRGRTVGLVVIHDMEHPETPGTAMEVARWFAGPTAPQASAHYLVDDAQVVQGVRDMDVAWHAPGANSNGIGVEHAGYAAQRREDWADAYSTAELHLSAELVRGLCAKYGIPAVFLDAPSLLAGMRGITTHAEVSAAWHQTDHTDPGPGFPMDLYLAMVRNNPPAPPAPGGAPVANANAPFAAILVHPAGGYLEVGTDGGIFAWGGAPFYGSLGGTHLNQPIVAAEWAPDHAGYYLLGRDGGIFAFGSAVHQGNALWAG